MVQPIFSSYEDNLEGAEKEIWVCCLLQGKDAFGMEIIFLASSPVATRNKMKTPPERKSLVGCQGVNTK